MATSEMVAIVNQVFDFVNHQCSAHSTLVVSTGAPQARSGETSSLPFAD
jgi:hypothetical protein